jgi:8-oxo-dGTP pyrophosphatase MutT (NUDIX family)
MPRLRPRRDTARVILANPDDRVLLFRYLLPTPWAREGWLTPGGAIGPGETPAQAAARELAEETGYLLPVTGIGPAVAVTSGRWQDASGTTITTTNWYFFARAASSHIDLSGQADSERRGLLGHRWWTVSELCATLDPVLPIGLAALLRQLLADDKPQRPVRLPWS